MAELPPVAQRHLDLWQQREKRLAQLVCATLLFALLAEWKVVGPLADDAREHARLQEQSREGTARLQESTARLEALAPIADTLERVGETIRGEPWRAPTEELKRQYAALRGARDLMQRDLGQARAILAGETREDLADTLSPEVAVEENAPAAPAYEQANPANAMRQPERHEPGREDRLGAPPEVVALARLDLSSELARTVDDAALREQLGESFGRRVVALAQSTVAEIERIVAAQVDRPIADAVEAAPSARLELASVQAALADLRKLLSEWTRSHASDLSWTDTVDTKRETMDELSDVMRRWRNGLASTLKTRQEAITGKVEEAKATIAALQREDEKLAERQLALKEQVEGLLPEWVKGFVTPAELARTYPLVLAALAVLIAAVSLLVRHHFIACRDALYPAGEARRDPALASCFTLVFRGWRGTLWTLATWVALTWAWCHFAALGLAQATRLWSDGFLGPNPIDPGWLAPARWILLAAPWLAGVGMVAMLLDRRRAPAPAARPRRRPNRRS